MSLKLVELEGFTHTNLYLHAKKEQIVIEQDYKYIHA
jgi:hypothetical protein